MYRRRLQGERTRVYAMPPAIADGIPIGRPQLGYKWRLAEFEKSPMAHILSVKYDPYGASFIAWYIGGFGLVGALMSYSFFLATSVYGRVSSKKRTARPRSSSRAKRIAIISALPINSKR